MALKIIKPGMDSKQVIARFEAEQQALALLDHPNIAHVFDAGTTQDGHPYFAMEYVRGIPITEHCDKNKLTIDERLKLFQSVCQAVQHAHQKGIIHRDIKPSNILVQVQGQDAVAKVIDFGVAKALGRPLTDRTVFTEQGQLIGTPEYMSPEQAEMAERDIDTRTDVYSLGVVLYELLTGALPFDPDTLRSAAIGEIQRIIRDEEPPKPSTRLSSLGEEATKIAQSRRTDVATLARRLYKELEWIPMMAMRKERERRYRSAADLGQDIENYVNGDPLIAGPESVAYRAKKFARKHTAFIASVAAILAVLLAALVVSTMMYFGAEQAREKESIARTEAEQAREEEAIARNEAEQAKNAEREQRELAERSLYVNRINLAEKYYQESNIGRVRELLAACPNDLRCWEWHYLWDISDESLMTLRGHTYGVYSVAFSPDGKRIVSGSLELKVWDAESASELLTLRGHKSWVLSIAFSPDGKRVVSGSGDNTLKVWDAESGVELMTLRGHTNFVRSVAFSPDGKRVVSGSGDNTLKVWGPVNRKAVAAGKIVDELYQEHGFYYDVIDVLKVDKTLDESVRNYALQIANSLKWKDPVKLNEESWKIVSLPDGNAVAYQEALSKAEKAVSSAPNDWRILNTLGVAQYRVGKYEDALKTLASSDKKRTDANQPSIPEGWAFMAMALHKLARAEEAKAALSQRRPLLRGVLFTLYAEGEEAKGLFAEVLQIAGIKPIKSVVPEKNLAIPEGAQNCAAKLQEIHTAIKQYQKDKGAFPKRLSALVPGYVSAETLFCPNDPEHKTSYFPDPNLPCSYTYDFSDDLVQVGLTCRERKTQQMKLFGEVVPIVRCMHHGSETIVSLSVGGQVYWSRLNWELVFMPDYQSGDERLILVPVDANSETQQKSKAN